MLNRQKLLLYMMERAERPVTHLEMTKWAFLLAHEMPSRGGNSFYQFLPYQRGPFSFCLYQEMGCLARDGYVVEAEEKTWRLTDDVQRPTGNLPYRVQEDAARVVTRFEDKTPDALVDYVYPRFPWFTVNSAIRQLEARPVAPIKVYTIGYEGWLVDGFLNALLRAGIQRVLDVRNNPVARRYGFHKSTMERLCKKLQIEYLHFPQLGIPSEQRQGLETPTDYKLLFDQYEAVTLPHQMLAVKQAAAIMGDKPTALMCMEADPSQCHRSRLADAIAVIVGLPVIHLGEHYEAGI